MHESFERITSQHAHCQFLQWLGTANDSKALLLIKIALLGMMLYYVHCSYVGIYFCILILSFIAHSPSE